MIGPNYCVVFQLGIWDAGFGRKISPSRDGPSDFAICDEVVGTLTPSNYSHTMYLVGICLLYFHILVSLSGPFKK